MQHRYRCKACKWDGPQMDIKEHKKLCGKPFPVCPNCGQYKEKVIDPKLSFTYNRSTLSSYAIKDEAK